MPFRPLAYLKFLLKSTNQHGVHSPFVFAYVTRCLYGQKKYSKDKSVDVLLKSIQYFQASNLHVESDKVVQQKIQEAFDQVDFDSPPNDILFFGQLDESTFLGLLKEGKLHNDSMILIDSIHLDSKKEADWNKLVGLSDITVSIDMFYCGAIFIRREQVKQDFTIRI